MVKLIGKKHEGFEIVEVAEVNNQQGYCLACDGHCYVTWFVQKRGDSYEFYHGHYSQVDWDAPAKSRALGRADLFKRVSDHWKQQAKYGY